MSAPVTSLPKAAATAASSTPPPSTDRHASTASGWRTTRSPQLEIPSAERRVVEYLRARGLTDGTRLRGLSAELVRESADADGCVRAEDAVAHAQRTIERFMAKVFGEDAGRVQPLWLRAFIQAHPDVFLGDPEAARAAVRRFGDPLEGAPPTHAHFEPARLSRLSIPRWFMGLLPPLVLSAGATALLARGLDIAAAPVLASLWLLLFAFLFTNAAVGFFIAVRGFVLELRRDRREPRDEANAAPLPRSAVVVPIYHEDAEHVFAAVSAMRASLAATPFGDAFEIFVLSDSRKPECIAEEERAFRRVVSAERNGVAVFYRRRARNDRQKAGNLAEFLERWGHRYTYAVVLDADSLMSGATMVEMTRRMHESPRLGLLQAPLAMHRGKTLFARAQQFAASLSGPLFTHGLGDWADDCGNYYGHNAVIRVRAFLNCCALPTLAGRPPLGGHILSHDFVEAALLCRAGWEVRIAHDLGESWEELPPTLPEYVARDRRWCQGNLQHLRIVSSGQLRPMSRVHMLVGASAYLAGPVWLAFVALGVALSGGRDLAPVSHGVAVAVASLVVLVLIGPRLMGMLATLRQPARRQHGGTYGVVGSTLLELVISSTMAPLMMVHHARIVLSILIGRSIRWGSQSRRSAAPWRAIVASELAATLLGAATAATAAWLAPAMLLPLAPLWVPLLLAIPFAAFLSSRLGGRVTEGLGLLRVPSETEPHPLAERVTELCSFTSGDESGRYRDLVLDPLLVHTQLERVNGEPGTRKPESREAVRLRERALRGGPAMLSAAEWRHIVHQPESLQWLHVHAWRHWPIETWDLAREQPQLPPES